jgi:hypothetical protein
LNQKDDPRAVLLFKAGATLRRRSATAANAPSCHFQSRIEEKDNNIQGIAIYYRENMENLQ